MAIESTGGHYAAIKSLFILLLHVFHAGFVGRAIRLADIGEILMEGLGFDFLLEKIAFIEEEKEWCVGEPLEAGELLVKIEALQHSVRPSVLLERLVVLVQRCQVDNSIYILETVQP